MVRIQLATGYLDVKEGTSFPLSFQVGDIRDISQRKGSFSKTITLVGSKNNNDLLNHYYDVNIVAGTFNINALTTCSVIQDGIPVMENASMQLTSVKKVQLTEQYEEHVEYEVLIKESKADFFTAINNKELTDIDFSDFNHAYDAFNVVSRFSNTVVNGFKYFLPGSGSVFTVTQEYKPAIFAKTYFDRIFQDAGFTYSWPDLVDDKFDRLVIPYNGDTDNFDYNDYTVKASAGPKTFISTGFAGSVGANPTFNLTTMPWTEIEDPQGIFNPVLGNYTIPFNISSNNSQQYDYSVTMTYELRLVNSHTGTLYSGTNTFASPVFYRPRLLANVNTTQVAAVNLYTNPAPLNGSTAITYAVQSPTSIPVGTTTILSQTVTANIPVTAPSVPSGATAFLKFDVIKDSFQLPNQPALNPSWKTGSATGPQCAPNQIRMHVVVTSINISITPSNNIYASAGIIDVNDYVPQKIKQNDFVKGIFNMFNLYADVDKNQPNQLNLIHRDDYYDAGKEVDWTYKLAKDREQSLSFLPELTSKKLILTYAPDKDKPNTIYTDATNQIYGQAEVVFDNEYVKDVTTKPVLFGPTPIIDTVFGAYVPMLAGAQPDTNIRILYDSTAEVGLTPCQAFNIYDYGTVGMTGVTSYPYVGHFDDPLNPTWDLNFATCAYYYYMPSSLTQNNLYNRYWRRTMGQINNGKMLTAMFNLKEPDIQAMKLNDKIRIDNSWWNINRVIDYNANANQLTQVELISIDSEVNFMPFATGSPSPGVGVGSVGPMTQVANDTIVKTKTANTNIIPNSTSGLVTGKGNNVNPGLKVVVVADDATIEEDGIYTDNLTVYGKVNGIPVDPSCYKYVANLDQTGTADPIAYVKEGSFGDILWVRNAVGAYEGFIQNWDLGAILDTELTVMINNVYFDCVISAQYIPSNNSIFINTSQIGVGFVDDYLGMNTLEIRYYKP